MFDTIHIELPKQDIGSLKNKSDTIDCLTGEVKSSTGFSDCIKVRETRGIIMIECSLSKLIKGNNIYSLSFLEVILALEAIENKLSISIMKGIVRRLDCEITIETCLTPISYFRYFGSSRYYTRKEISGTSLYYTNKSRSINIYDKIKERKAKRTEIPVEFIGKNIFRFECRYKNSSLKIIAKNNYLENIKVEDIINPSIYKNLCEVVYNEYESIFKINKPIISNLNNTVNSKAEFMRYLANIGIESLGGVNEVHEMIDASKQFNPDVRKEYFSRRKKDIRDISTGTIVTLIENIITEIDQKIEQKHLLRLKSVKK